MPVSSTAVTVAATATPLFLSATARRRFFVSNDSGSNVYIGGSDVTSVTGYTLATGKTFEVSQQFPTDGSAKYQWFAITGAGNLVVRVVEVRG